jgi:DNA-directed RNA polymerase specialized sigma subunit
MSEPELFDLVYRAKSGDQAALEKILARFQPAIRKAVRKAKLQDRRDLEQVINEKIIRAVYAYDLDSVPDFSRFVQVVAEMASHPYAAREIK